MKRDDLIAHIKSKGSFLCVGLDTDTEKLPEGLEGLEGVLQFNKHIIDATKAHCVAYKINTAFYESQGKVGWEIMCKTIEHIPDSHFLIADAKRGDIGNTSSQYAKAFFSSLECDAITVAPYMGEDSVLPFMGYENKWVILLALTSNKGSKDFQLQKLEDGSYLYEKVLERSAKWGTPESMMFVVGATQQGYLKAIRAQYPEHFFLVPGVGAQGGSLDAVADEAMTKDVGLLVNASRSILYASSKTDYAKAAAREAEKLHRHMKSLMDMASLKV